MKFARFLVFLIAFFNAPAARASDLCEISAALERLQSAQIRFSTQSTLSTRSADVLHFIAQSGRLNSDHTVSLLASKVGSGSAGNVGAFLERTHIIAAYLRNDNPSAAQRILLSNMHQKSLTLMQSIVRTTNCIANDPAPGKDTSQSARGKSKGQAGSALDTESSVVIIIAIVAIVLAIVVIWYGIFAYFRFRQSRRRRAKRYPTSISARIKTNSSQFTCRILDLSCDGAKLSVPDLSKIKMGQATEIWLFDAWRKANFAWVNQHYCGVKFNVALEHKDVRLASLKHSNVKWKLGDTKTAPT